MPAKTVKKKKAKKSKRQARKPRGRPKKYNAAYVKQAHAAARNNLTDKQLAELFGVEASTVAKWKVAHSDFAEAIEEGRAEFATGQVELSFRQQALPHDEVTQLYELRGKDTKTKKNRKMTLVGKRVKKDAVNVHAAERVLKAEMPEKYGDKVKVGVDAQSLADIAAIMKGKDGS